MFRVHQFNKVEMFSFTTPEESRDEHERLLAVEEELVAGARPPVPRRQRRRRRPRRSRRRRSTTSRRGSPASSATARSPRRSNTTDFQARRLGDPLPAGERGLEHVHTLNGTAVTARALIAILENFQQEDGSVAVPAVLERYGAPSRVEAAG